MKLTPLFAALLATAALAGCATDVAGDNEDGTGQSDDAITAAVDLPFTIIDAKKSAAPAGLRVIESLAEYKSFFGAKPPAGVDFSKHDVVFYSLGVKNTGGYSVDITQITRRGSYGYRTLDVAVHAVSPGPKCMVTQALTNPQVAVRIAKQAGVKSSSAKVTNETKACGGQCTSADQCPGSKIACKLCADGSAACPQTTCTEGVCGIKIDQCPEDMTCGGIAGIQCPKGYACVDDPNDGCDPAKGGADCGGKCQKVPQTCGGIAGIQCPKGYTCVDDPTDGCDPANGGADCGGKCQKECTGPIPSCAPPPVGCHYEGGGCVDGNNVCGKLVCATACGDSFCGAGTYCCNPVMGICAKIGMLCIQLAHARGTSRLVRDERRGAGENRRLSSFVPRACSGSSCRASRLSKPLAPRSASVPS